MNYVERRTQSSLAAILPHLDVELTERCNNACMHCYINLSAADDAARRREFSTDEWQDIFRQAADLGTLSIRFTGGEPLLREDFSELYLSARRLGTKVQLFTNARLLTPELAVLFSRIPPLQKIEITVYGLTPATYDAAACSPGAYQEFRQGLELLLQYQVPFIVKWALLPPNRHELGEFEQWAAALPWAEASPPSTSMEFDLRARRDSPARNQMIERLRPAPEEAVAHSTRDAERYRREMAQFFARFTRPPGDTLFTCGAGHSLHVDAYGHIQGCMLLRDPALTVDARLVSLARALTDLPARLGALKATHPAYLERCARCFLRGLCESCPAKSWMEHGALDIPVDYHCQIAHTQARFLGLLSSSENAWEIVDWQERVSMLQLDEVSVSSIKQQNIPLSESPP
jgi:radical SAM protein with 4Fe4S-binding SPASM domain